MEHVLTRTSPVAVDFSFDFSSLLESLSTVFFFSSLLNQPGRNRAFIIELYTATEVITDAQLFMKNVSYLRQPGTPHRRHISCFRQTWDATDYQIKSSGRS